MSELKAYGNNVNSIFQLIGDKENDITISIAWVLNKCPEFLCSIINEIFSIRINTDETIIFFQKYDARTGITDIEITDRNEFHVIIEAKRGWILPGAEQLTKYSLRVDFKNSSVPNKAIVTMSECSEEYARNNLPFLNVNGIPVKHLSWKTIYDYAEKSKNNSNNEQKKLLNELKVYLGGIMTMQTKESNWVYVVSLSRTKLNNSSITYVDIVNKYNRYFHVAGKNKWPKDPPNYIAFRYDGKLQSIHHIESYVVTKNMHDEIEKMPDEEWEDNHFIYRLGPAIIPQKEIKTGNIFRNGRVWAMLDTLLTSDTISEARDISKNR